VIVVATDDFELYHDAVSELRDRGVDCTTIEPGEELPDDASVVVTGQADGVGPLPVPVVRAAPGEPREAVDTAIARLRGGDGRRVVGIDPGETPGVAVLDGEMIVATFRVPPEDVPAVVRDEIETAPNPLVRIGDGARLIGARLIEEFDDVQVELVDEAGTTPYLGTGTRGTSDVLAAVNIARLEGERIDSRNIQPTDGELTRVQERSREASQHNRTIGVELARRVALGELTIQEALDTHQED